MPDLVFGQAPGQPPIARELFVHARVAAVNEPQSTPSPGENPELPGDSGEPADFAGSSEAESAAMSSSTGLPSGGLPSGVPSSSASAEADPMDNVRELVDVPSVEVISRAAVMLMSSAAEKLGLGDDEPDSAPGRDLDEARRLITALAGLVTASAEYLGLHAAPIRDGLQSLQRAFREASAVPDPPGQGPGDKYTGPVR